MKIYNIIELKLDQTEEGPLSPYFFLRLKL